MQMFIKEQGRLFSGRQTKLVPKIVCKTRTLSLNSFQFEYRQSEASEFL